MSQLPGLFNDKGDMEVTDEETDVPRTQTLSYNAGNDTYIGIWSNRRRKYQPLDASHQSELLDYYTF